MSLLPLSDSAAVGEPECMNQPAIPPLGRSGRSGRSGESGRSRHAALLVRFAHRVRDVIAECAQAQRRMAELTTAPDRYLLNPDAAPDTYAEFLYRTSGLMRHEPPARARGPR